MYPLAVLSHSRRRCFTYNTYHTSSVITGMCEAKAGVSPPRRSPPRISLSFLTISCLICLRDLLHYLPHLLRGGTTLLCIRPAPMSPCYGFLPLWYSLAIRITFSGIFFPFLFFAILISLSFLCLSFSFLSFIVHGFLACVCCVCRIQYDCITLHRLLPVQHYDEVSLCRNCVTKDLYLPRISTDTGCARCRRIEQTA